MNLDPGIMKVIKVIPKSKRVPEFFTRDETMEFYSHIATQPSNQGAFMAGLELATGQYAVDLFQLKMTDFITNPFRISLERRWVEVDEYFLKALLKRIDFCEEIKAPYLFYRTDNLKKRKDLGILKSERDKFMQSIDFVKHKHHPRVLRLTWAVKMLIEKGWSVDKISRQLALPQDQVVWMSIPTVRVKLQSKWEGESMKPHITKLRTVSKNNNKGGHSFTEHLTYYTDGELCQVYKTILKLENQKFFPDWTFLVRLILGSGLRVAEAAALTKDDIDLAYDPPIVLVRNGKGGKSRAIQVIPEVGLHIRKYIRKLDSHWIFPSKYTSTHATEQALKDGWKRIILETGVRYLSIHKGRHTFATWEAERLPPHKLKDKLGHASLDMTEKFYRHCIVGRDYTDEPPKWRSVALRQKVLKDEEFF